MSLKLYYTLIFVIGITTLNMAASKSIIADLNHGDKLNEKNYDVWHRKIEYLLEEQEMLETITQPMVEPEQGDTAQHRLDMEAYQTYKRKDRVARILMLSSMRNDIMLRFERHRSTQSVWDAIKNLVWRNLHY